MKIVADTNVWISGLLWKGLPAHLLRLAERGDIEIWSSDAMVAEFERVLGYKRIQQRLHRIQLSYSDVMEFALELMAIAIVEPTTLKGMVSADPDDDIFLACALTVGASYLVSGDRHLLDLGAWQGIQIVTVNDFLEQHFPGNPQADTF